MPPDDISVTLALGSTPYQKTLASSLLSAGMLRRTFSLGPYLEAQDPGADGSLKVVKRFRSYQLVNRFMWGIWRRLPRKAFPLPPIVVTAWLADRLMSRWIEPSRIFHACTAFSLASMRAAKRKGTITLVDIGTRHPRHWRDAAEEECRRFDVVTREGAAAMPEALMRRQEREFQLCDHIVVPSRVARQSFAQMGYEEKTVVVPGGVDTAFFSARSRLERPPLFRACFVGRLEMPKGLGYLLQAWKRLGLPRAELVLVGAANPEMKAFVKANGGPTARMVGMLPPHGVAKSYRESSVLVFPSVTEGLAQVLLEAMASGLPVIATERSGAGDCVAHRKEGFVVPTHDPDALADAILWCYQHPDETYAMGDAARARIENEFTLEHYNQRQIALYRSLIESRGQPLAGRPLAGSIGAKG